MIKAQQYKNYLHQNIENQFSRIALAVSETNIAHTKKEQEAIIKGCNNKTKET